MTMTMTIIAGHVTMAEADRTPYVEAHQEMVGRARAFDGCIDVSISPDLLDPTRINILEVWESAEKLDAWRGQADPPELDVDFDDGALARYDATDGGPMF